MRFPIPYLCAALTLALAGGAAAQGGAGPAPDPNAVPVETLRQQIAQELPGVWRISEVLLDAQVNVGTAVEPQVRSRLRAVLALGAPTFAIVQQEGPFTFVQPVASAGMERTLHARSTSTMRAGRWETRFEIETPEVLAVPGTPDPAIPGRIILVNSDEERQLRAAWQAQAEQRNQEALAEQRRVEALAEARRASEAAEAAARREREEADAVAAARWTAAAEAAMAQAREAEAKRAAEEAIRIAEARRAAAEAAEAAARREREAQAQAQANAAAEAEARRRQLEADAVAAAQREVAAESARAQAREAEAKRAAEEVVRLTEARAAAAAVLEATARREAEAQIAAQRAAVEGRAAQIAELRALFRAEDRNLRIAAMERAMRSEDLATRALGYEAALASADAATLQMGLRLWFQQTREVPVSFFVPASQPLGNHDDPTSFANALSSTRLSIREFDTASGRFTGVARIGNRMHNLSGTLSRTEMTVTLQSDERSRELGGLEGIQQCTLSLRLSEIQTLDGHFVCDRRGWGRPAPLLLVRVPLG